MCCIGFYPRLCEALVRVQVMICLSFSSFIIHFSCKKKFSPQVSQAYLYEKKNLLHAEVCTFVCKKPILLFAKKLAYVISIQCHLFWLKKFHRSIFVIFWYCKAFSGLLVVKKLLIIYIRAMSPCVYDCIMIVFYYFRSCISFTFTYQRQDTYSLTWYRLVWPRACV